MPICAELFVRGQFVMFIIYSHLRINKQAVTRLHLLLPVHLNSRIGESQHLVGALLKVGISIYNTENRTKYMLAGQLCGGKITLVDYNDKAEAFQKML
jgi:hypothetical protein